MSSAATDLGSWDVVVMGAGPAGSSAATLLARQGHRVLVLEKETFPRYHIGESLIPGCLRVLDALGVREDVEGAGFTVKRGVTFWWGIDHEWSISFDEQQANPNYSFQVERSRFDEILLTHARRSGADVRTGVAVRHVDFDGGDPVVASDAGVARARYVVDATGQSSLLGRRLGERHFDESLRNVAIWRYYRGCARLPAPRSGDIAIVRHGDGWWWYIPLEAEEGGLTSLGVVLSADSYRRQGADPDVIYERTRTVTPELERWLKSAYPVGDLRVTADWSYRSRRVAAEKWLLAGDAAGFIDPLLSTGCYLALTAGYLAGLCLGSALRDSALRPAAFRYYQDSYDRVVDEIHAMVHVVYRMVRSQDVFEGAQTILGLDGDPRELFIRLAAGNVDQSTGPASLGGETGLPSEVFGVGVHRKSLNHYGVPFATDRERVLGEVDPADLPQGVEGPMMLVECDVQLRLVPPTELEKPVEEEGPAEPVAPPEPPRPPLLLSEVRCDEDAEAFLEERVPATQRPFALLVFHGDAETEAVIVGFTGAAVVESYWKRYADVALVYFTDPGSSPFERPSSRGLLEAVERVARTCSGEDLETPETLRAAVAARVVHPGWRIEAQATAPEA